MAGDVALLFAVARKMGIGAVGAAAAGALLVVATPAVRGWLQLMAEPMALALLLGATWLAIDFRTAVHWKRRAVGIALLLGAAFQCKEIDGALGVMVVAVAWFWPAPGPEDAPLLSPRNLLVAGLAAAAALVEAALLVAVRHAPRATGYGMAYGSGAMAPGRLLDNIVAIVMPVRAEGHAALDAVYPANVLVVLAVVLGLLAVVRVGGGPRVWRYVAFGVGCVLVGAVAYWPWPKFDSFYALPFFAAAALLYGAAIGRLREGSTRERGFALLAAIVVPLYGAIPASRSTETAAASLHLNADFAHLLTRFAPGDTIAVLDPESGPRRLPVDPSLLRTYAVAVGLAPDTTRLPAVVAVGCNGPGTAAPGAVASYSYGCGRIRAPQLRLVAPYSWRDWLTLASVQDTVSVDFAGPLIMTRLLGHASP